MSYFFKILPDGIADLRQHLRNCILPPLGYEENDPLLPPKGHASHRNHLSVRPETYRRFENINGIPDSVWCLSLEKCLDSLVPTSSFGTMTRALTSIVCSTPPYFHSTLKPRPDHLQGCTLLSLLPWLEKFPFTTVKRILHQAVPQTHSWTFSRDTLVHSEPDSHMFTTYTWAMSPDCLAGNTPSQRRQREAALKKRMLIAVQPPWVLTERDLEKFSDSRNFPAFMAPGAPFPESLDEARHRVWAKVWDACAREKIHYFVLTSYTHWVFGVFSPGYTTAWTSQAVPFDNKVPTIVEMLSYWAISAMGIDGGYKPPQVAEPFHRFPARIHPPRLPHQCHIPEDSESSWGGSSIGSCRVAPSTYSSVAHISPLHIVTDSEDSAEICPSLWSFSQGECTYEAKMYDPQKSGQNPTVEEWIRSTMAEASRSKAEIETSDSFVDPLATIPYVIQVFREPRLSGEQASLVGDWLV
ncbi:hypothetical protein NMY22_g4102 [Coprinellus aureogranulatus]|nr:hypothetical protein NMY22_g4102 [Coprinellus aureogranulatus]